MRHIFREQWRCPRENGARQMFSDNPIHEFRGPWGIPVQIGVSIFLLPLFFIDFGGDARSLYYDVIFLGLVIGSIFLHELGHAWGYLVQGQPVRRIMIYGGGGFCQGVRSGTPREEEFVVAMGPIVTAVLWAGCGLIWPLFPVYNDFVWALHSLAWINGFLLLLNLVPVLPLDGGKLLHLLLLRRMRPALAEQVTGFVGVILTILWIPMMIWCFWSTGMVLFFFPPLMLHWRMFRQSA